MKLITTESVLAMNNSDVGHADFVRRLMKMMMIMFMIKMLMMMNDEKFRLVANISNGS